MAEQQATQATQVQTALVEQVVLLVQPATLAILVQLVTLAAAEAVAVEQVVQAFSRSKAGTVLVLLEAPALPVQSPEEQMVQGVQVAPAVCSIVVLAVRVTQVPREMLVAVVVLEPALVQVAGEVQAVAVLMVISPRPYIVFSSVVTQSSMASPVVTLPSKSTAMADCMQ
jgi:hypothetical protein